MQIPAEKKYKVVCGGGFKDGNLTAEMKKAGFQFYEIDPAVVRESVAVISHGLYQKMLNSGAEMEIIDTVYRPVKEEKEEPEEPEDSELEEVTLEMLDMTSGAYQLAKEEGLSAVEILVYLVDQGGVNIENVSEFRITKPDVDAVLMSRKD